MTLRIDRIPNRNYRPTILLREHRREGQRIVKKTLCNLTAVQPTLVAGIEILLAGGIALDSPAGAFRIVRTLPHGAAAAVLGCLKQLGLERILGRSKTRNRQIAVGALAARLLNPDSKLATARRLSPDTADSSLGAMLQLGAVSGNEVLAMLKWLSERQKHIQGSLARRHLKRGTLMLYDVTSSYVEGRCNALADYGYNRDRKKDKMQLVYGLLCSAEGCPVAIEVFRGNTSDAATLAPQIATLKKRFDIEHIALAGDRGLINARIRSHLHDCGLDWISALKAPDIRKLCAQSQQRPSALDPAQLADDQVAEIISDDFPGERLMVCLNPRRREDRRRNREQLLDATESALSDIAATVSRKGATLHSPTDIARRVQQQIGKWKMTKHFDIQIAERSLTWQRCQSRIDAESRLDGIYVIRTSLDATVIGSLQAVESYKSLYQVERAFRCLKTDLDLRPVYVYSETSVRGHALLCMLAYYVEWHLRRQLAPLLFEDHDRSQARTKRTSPVEKAQVSERAKRKADRKKTDDGYTVSSFRSLLECLSACSLVEIAPKSHPQHTFILCAEPTPIQNKAFQLLKLNPRELVPMKLTA